MSILLDDRIGLHPLMFGLSDKAFRAFISAVGYVAQFRTDWLIPTRIVSVGVARQLIESGLFEHDGGVYRVTPAARELAQIGPVSPESAIGLDSKALDLAPKPEGSKALALEDELLGAFERFWKAFDLKSGKQEARVAWAKAVKRADPEFIIEAAAHVAEWYANYPSGAPEPPKRKYAQGWLNHDRWEDILPPYPNPNGRPQEGRGAALIREAAEMAEEGR
jgi:hypothetical protein